MASSIKLQHSPVERDKRPVVVMSPAPEGWLTWFTGASDDPNPTPPSTGRGSGDRILVSMDGPGDGYVHVRFNEPVEVHDGQLIYTPAENWTVEDYYNFSAIIPANTVELNGSQTGNCNAVDTGGGFNIIVPANGNGYHDIDLATAVPVWSDDNTGYWDVNLETGEVSPSKTPGKAEWNLLDIPIRVYLLRMMPMGHALGVLDIDVYKTEYVHNRWILELSVSKQSEGPGKIAGWLLLFRKHTNEI